MASINRRGVLRETRSGNTHHIKVITEEVDIEYKSDEKTVPIHTVIVLGYFERTRAGCCAN